MHRFAPFVFMQIYMISILRQSLSLVFSTEKHVERHHKGKTYGKTHGGKIGVLAF